eukprot:jgi/Chlat1/7663/Chrsp64S07125
MEKVTVDLKLESDHLDWLERMAVKYALPDPGKALRICLQHVLASTAKDPAFELVVFKQIRCLHCSNKNKSVVPFSIDTAHLDMLEKAKATYQLRDVSKAARIVLDYSSDEADEATLFGVVRCRGCDKC